MNKVLRFGLMGTTGILSLAMLVFPYGSNATGTSETKAALERFEGVNRADTAAKISKSQYPTDHSQKYAVLVNRDSFADAVAAGAFAAMKQAPLLLTAAESLDGPTATELDRVLKTSLTTTTGETTSPAAIVYIVGGESAISADVVTAVKAIRSDIDTERISGDTRYVTAVALAKKMDSIRGSGPSAVFLADGETFADSMTAGVYAGNKLVSSNYAPVVLVKTDDVPDSVATYLDGFGVTSVSTGEVTPPPPALSNGYVLGGLVRVSQTVFDELDTYIKDLMRIAGDDRYETAANAAETFFGTSNPPSKIGVARGDEFADALAAVPFLATNKDPLILTKPDELPNFSYSYILGHKDSILGGWIFGGEEAVDATVKTQIEEIYM
jgi:putative cell wall-binding protein